MLHSCNRRSVAEGTNELSTTEGRSLVSADTGEVEGRNSTLNIGLIRSYNSCAVVTHEDSTEEGCLAVHGTGAIHNTGATLREAGGSDSRDVADVVLVLEDGASSFEHLKDLGVVEGHAVVDP